MKSGFTLIELLVAIALVGVVSAVGFTSFINTQRIARNSKRSADLKAIQNALETYFSNNSAYPGASCNPGNTYFTSGGPKDPLTNAPYTTTNGLSKAVCTTSSYCICSNLEGSVTTGNATNNTCTYGSGSYFCISNAQ